MDGRRFRRLRGLPLLLTAGAILLPAAAPAGAATTALGLPCAAQDGVLICSGLVTSSDGVPIDTNVALPAGDVANAPLIIISHGYGGNKSALNSNTKGPGEQLLLPWSQRGYVALSITARGFKETCGSPMARLANPAGCAGGYIRLDDLRYEARDVQDFAGKLADEGKIDPQRIGATGISYGGGLSLDLATLRNRVMEPDGTLKPWLSPMGKPLQLAGAAPLWPWSDLVHSLVPNGTTLDTTIAQPDDSSSPTGVLKQSYVAGLYALGNTAPGFYSPPGVNMQADITAWFATLNAGEPYDGNPEVDAVKAEIKAHHSPYHLDHSVAPAPLFIENGWADDLFPPDEAIRYYNRVRSQYPQVPIALDFTDVGHARSQNKPADFQRVADNVAAFMDSHVKGDGTANTFTGVEIQTLTCPKATASGRAQRFASWVEAHPGEVRFQSPGQKSFTSAGGDAQIAQTIDPIAGSGACAQVAAADQSNSASYRLPAATGSGFTILGAPQVVATYAVTGANAQVDAHLWDIDKAGKETLIDRAVYRPGTGGLKVFQLHPAGWKVEPGHVLKLELLGADAPFVRASNGAFQVAVSNLDLRIPTLDKPGATSQVTAPVAAVIPAGATPVKPRLALRVSRKRGCRTHSLVLRLTGRDRALVKSATFVVGGTKRNAGKSLSRTITASRSVRRVSVVVRLKDGRKLTLRAGVRRCPRGTVGAR